jgi:cutinase
MHSAAKDIPIHLYSRIKSLVMFGDGYHRLGDVLSRFPVGLNSKVMQVCADGDPVRASCCNKLLTI